MKKASNTLKQINVFIALMGFVTLMSCNDDEGEDIMPTENSKDYALGSVVDPGISGSATFTELSDGTVEIILDLSGTPDGGMHPAHIHANTAVEGGDIVLTLNEVDGSTGMSTTVVSVLNDGTPISFTELLAFDGYINVHLSATEISTIVAQGDIGQNELTGESKDFELDDKAVDGINGSATFYERLNGEALAEISLVNTPDGGSHPAHIHANTAVEGGGIIFSFNPVDGTSGISKTNISALDDGTALTYDDILTIDGYINVHLASDEMSTIVAQGDIGQNELTGESKEYDLGESAVVGISGIATFMERANGEALAELALDNTPEGGSHPAHIHANSAAEGGGIIFSFNAVDGTTGISETNVAALDDGAALTYEDVLSLDGYINVHLASDQMSTIVAQGDIGQNELTGEMKAYELSESAVAGISGFATFYERVNGEALAMLSLDNTPEGGTHPAHIHANTAVEGGGILFSFNPVDGTSGMSKTNVAALDDGTALTYSDILSLDGYINVHLASDQMSTIVAQGDIGQNELTGESVVYDLVEKDVVGISGTATFSQRINGEALALISLVNTPVDGSHPAHIHANSVAEGGGIIFSFNDIDGTSGMSKTNVAALDDGTALTYDEILTIDGYINVHLAIDQLPTIVAQGNIGSNE